MENIWLLVLKWCPEIYLWSLLSLWICLTGKTLKLTEDSSNILTVYLIVLSSSTIDRSSPLFALRAMYFATDSEVTFASSAVSPQKESTQCTLGKCTSPEFVCPKALWNTFPPWCSALPVTHGYFEYPWKWNLFAYYAFSYDLISFACRSYSATSSTSYCILYFHT